MWYRYTDIEHKHLSQEETEILSDEELSDRLLAEQEMIDDSRDKIADAG